MIQALMASLLAVPAPVLWLDAPVKLDGGINASDVAKIGEALERTIVDKIDGEVVHGRAAVLVPPPEEDKSIGLERARVLYVEGKESYFDFEFAPAAAAFAQAAVLLTNDLAVLDASDIERLCNARLLEGISWFQVDKKAASKAAFRELLTVCPQFEPDPAQVSPGARQVFQETLTEIKDRGFASLQVHSEPSGANVFVDGRSRGVTPLTVGELPPGDHALRVVLDGYQPSIRSVSLEPEQEVVSRLQLRPTALLASYQRVRAAARKGESLAAVSADLSFLQKEVGCKSIVLAGVAQRNGRLLVTLRRWTADAQSAVVVLLDETDVHQAVELAAPMLLRDTWPAVQLPVTSEPVRVDFSRALLGVGPTWGGEPAADTKIVRTWWFWTGVAAAVVGSATAGFLVATQESDSNSPDNVNFTVVFP